MYLIVYLSMAFVTAYCLVSGFSAFAMTAAALAVGFGIAAVTLRRTGFLAVSAAMYIVLYMNSVLPDSGRLRLLEAVLLGSALFLYVDGSHDLIVLRIRRIPHGAIVQRIGASALVLLLSAAMILGITTLGVNTLHYMPAIARLGVGSIAIAVLLGGIALYLFLRARESR